MLELGSETWQGTLAQDSVRVTQLEPGELLFARCVADVGSLRFLSSTANLGFRGQADLLPGRMIVGVVAEPGTDARWFGEPLRWGDIVQTDASADVTTHGWSKMYYVAIDKARLGVAGDGCRVHRSKEDAADLRRYIGRAFRIFSSASIESDCAIRTGIEQTLLPLLKRCLSKSSVFSESNAFSRRMAAVRKCEAYVREHIDENPTLSELCAVSGLRMRSLINAFQAAVGMSPMTYLRVQRLNEVHASLLELDPSATRVIDVAANWGFWHMGHFTESYRALFGELPSETLNARSRVLAVS